MQFHFRKWLITTLAIVLATSWAAAQAQSTKAAGSTAAAPVFAAWASAYAKTTPFDLNYDASGSSSGVKKATGKEVDFGASDVPPSDQELDAKQLVLIPMFVTGVTPVFNLGAVKGKLRLNGEVLAGIFSGAINHWNATEIQALNPDITLPTLPIVVVVRADGSGTTQYFSQYLSAMSSKWRQNFGSASTIAWPSNFSAVTGSDAVAKKVKSTAGSIGYVDYTHVQPNGLSAALLKNSADEYVTPSPLSFRAALKASELTTKGNLHASLVNMPGNASWPITMASYILLPRVSDTPSETTRALKFIQWTLQNGDQVVEKLNFVRMPDLVQARAFKGIMQVSDAKGISLGAQAARIP